MAILSIFGLGLACQAKGHSNRIPTFQTLPRIYGNNRKKKNRGKVRTTACKAYQCASKKARGNKNISTGEGRKVPSALLVKIEFWSITESI